MQDMMTETSSDSPLVSIVVPVYNSAKYLPDALGSLLGQTYGNIEVICVNDGSRDNSLEILKDYSKADPRVIVVDKENAGAGMARNTGMNYVRGEYMCFVDSDDFIEQDAVEKLVAAAQNNNADIVIFGMDQYDDRTGEYFPNTWAVFESHVPSGTVFRATDIDNCYKCIAGFTVNKLYRTSFLLGLELRFPLVGAHEDMPFSYIALSAANTVFYLSETLYHYRRAREGSLSDSTNNRYIYMFDALKCLRDGLVKRNLWDKHQQTFVNYALHMCVWKHEELGKFRRQEFSDACRTTWFDCLGISKHDESYFFDESDYNYVKHVDNLSLLRILVAKCYRIKLLLMGELPHRSPSKPSLSPLIGNSRLD